MTRPMNNQLKQPSDEQANADLHTYFDALYCGNSDPWQYQTRWYEKRKRDICLALLPKNQYSHAIELGCGNGVFSELLARRCQTLLSIDGNRQAVQLAEQRLADLSHVTIIQGVIPSVLSTVKNKSFFDLIIISEILYYLPPDDIDTVIDWIKQHLAKGGTLLCCHWRYAIDGFEMTGDMVHQRLQKAFNKADSSSAAPAFIHQSQVIDHDFLLDVWQYSTQSLAKQEGLI